MRTSAIFAAVVSAAMVAATPVPTKRALTDTDILQFALTLEHLENAFYAKYLGQFDQAAFAKAGFPDWVRNRISQIGEHEASHVALLQGALGAAATKPCVYSFPSVVDPSSFVGLSAVLESVGVSAYLGAASSISEAAYVTVAGSILTTESRHQGWVSSSGLHREGWSGPYDTPQQPSAVYSLAAQFITSCPSTNPALPVSLFAPTTFDPATGTITYKGQTATGQFAALYQGLNQAIYPVVNGKVTVPAVQGTAYLIPVSTGNLTLVGDNTFLGAPAIISTSFNSKVSNPAPAF